jgi:type VI secretion system protein ImpK
MGTFASEPAAAAEAGFSQRRFDNLALVFQETFTAIVRLRSNRQVVTDAELFRAQMREALRGAEQDALVRGYTGAQINFAKLAVVAFLDESVLNLQQPVFAHWPRKPLQEELFGTHVAGETFFHNIQHLLGMRDGHDVADVLEIYELCLLLGFRGRYGIGGQAELRSIIEAVKEKMKRIRGGSLELAPEWALPPGTVRMVSADPWVKRLLWAAVGCLVLVIVLFVVFKLSLNSGAAELRAIPSHSRTL